MISPIKCQLGLIFKPSQYEDHVTPHTFISIRVQARALITFAILTLSDPCVSVNLLSSHGKTGESLKNDLLSSQRNAREVSKLESEM
jgi:hypothetical protein